MGAFEQLFGGWKKKQPTAEQLANLAQYFAMLDGYMPVWSTYSGGVYEMELTRACIHTFASQCSKLMPHVLGPDLRNLQRVLDRRPNPFQTPSQFLTRAATIYEVKNTVYILPLIDAFDRTVGFYPADPAQVELLEVNGEPWIRFTFTSGKQAAIELLRCGVVSQKIYKNDFIGEDNSCMNPTLQLMNMQNQGITEGIKNAASFRFMASLGNLTKDEDLRKLRNKFVAENFGAESGGIALFPKWMTDVKQIESAAKVVDADQMKIIQDRVFDYFGTSDSLIKNIAKPEEREAYYEGKIEPFAIALSEAMTAMSYSSEQLTRGNEIAWSSNRMQFMSAQDKLQVSTQLFDRGVLSTNDINDIWQLPHVPDGDKRYIRKEYLDLSEATLEDLSDEVSENGDGTNDPE